MASWYASFHMQDSNITLHRMQGNDATEKEFVARCQRKAKQLGLVRNTHVIRVGREKNKPIHMYSVQ